VSRLLTFRHNVSVRGLWSCIRSCQKSAKFMQASFDLFELVIKVVDLVRTVRYDVADPCEIFYASDSR
jgi:hypothetical protein